jgi:hypothetical protein
VSLAAVSLQHSRNINLSLTSRRARPTILLISRIDAFARVLANYMRNLLMRTLERLESTRRVVALFTLPLLLTACGSSNGGGGSAAGAITGNWEITLQPSNSNLKPKTESGFLSQSNNAITGSMIFTDQPCSGVGSVSGTISGTAVSFVVSPTGVVVNHSGTFSSGQASMSGSYTILSTGCADSQTAPQVGTWTANLVMPLSGSIQGALMSNRLGTNLPLTGQVSQEPTVAGSSTASLTGSLSITSYCFTTANISGTVSGTFVVMNLLNSDGTQLGQIIGTSSTDGTSVSGTYNIIPQGDGSTQPCKGGDSGSVTLTL